MALPDNQPDRLRCYRNALRNWQSRGYVRFSARVETWLRGELDLSAREMQRLLFEYVAAGGTIAEVIEKRAEYVSYEFHYDLRVNIGARRVYFETVLVCNDANDPDDPIIRVVNIHDA